MGEKSLRYARLKLNIKQVKLNILSLYRLFLYHYCVVIVIVQLLLLIIIFIRYHIICDGYE